MENIQIIIVDDHPSVRYGLEAVLDKFEDITVVGVVDSGEKAVKLCEKLQPDVALIDVFMPRMNGIETTRILQTNYPDIKVIILTHSDSDEVVVSAMDAGAIGYLIKDAEIEDIADAIRAAGANKRTLSPGVLEAIIRAKTTPRPHPDNQLTDRELDVLRLMVTGLKNPQIAEELMVSLSTVKFHISAIFKKLDVRNRTRAVVKAMETGLIDGADS